MRFVLAAILVCAMSTFAFAQGPGGPHGRGSGGPPEWAGKGRQMQKGEQLPAPSFFGGRAWTIPGGPQMKAIPAPRFMGGPGVKNDVKGVCPACGRAYEKSKDKQVVKQKHGPYKDKAVVKHKKKHKGHSGRPQNRGQGCGCGK